MKVIIRLLNGFSVMDETQLPQENLTKSKMEDFLKSTYVLQSGYEITYVDPDGDEIMVEYDDDYEVAKITHQHDTLILTIKVQNQQWLSQFGWNDQKVSQDLQVTQNTDQKTQPISSTHQQTDNKKYSQLLQEKQPNEYLTSKNQDQRMKLQDHQLKQLNQAFQQKQLEEKETQQINSRKNKIQTPKKKKTQTQSQSSQSQQENQLLLPLPNIKTTLTAENDLITFDTQNLQTKIEKLTNQTNNQKKQTKKVKKQKKEKKQQRQKQQKTKEKNITLTEKQLKKLIKKQVLKLIPQISQQVKKSHADQYHSIKISISQFQKITSLNCSKCEQKLVVPFYINSSEGLKLCENCQKQDLSIVPLIKVRDIKMVENLIWAEPLCQLAKTPQHNAVKFYTDMKKSLQNELKEKMDKRIKHAKTEAKNEKAEQKMNKKKQEQTKKQKQNIQNPVESSSSSV